MKKQTQRKPFGRTPIAERDLPSYTKNEEKWNSITHAAGVAVGLIMLVLDLFVTLPTGDPFRIVSGVVYPLTVIVMFACSAVYHGLDPEKHAYAKKVMRVVDHCDIYATIAGTYTPIVLVALRPEHPTVCNVIFLIEWGLAAIAITLNAIDLKLFRVVGFAAYIGMGWCIIMAAKITVEAMTLVGFLWLLFGGIAFTIGAVLYLIGKKKRYAHTIFHVFVVLGIAIQYVGIIGFVL